MSFVFASQHVGVKEVEDKIYLVSFKNYDLGFFDLKSKKLEPMINPFGFELLPISPE